ncbi:hypothetical protein AB6N24_08910 [Cellulomonas sp. 179-A 4D5 NHS]|uniref:hypothetical protein n=1 Tax=Cellulomonas sp. 179-A 4D5 NHS TaxID=3142378 RepID=UPI0039A394ED
MDVRVLIVEDCPNGDAAVALARQALDDVGLPDVAVQTRLVTTREEAAELAFTGSPTILLNGRDPFAPPRATPALACRIYRTSTGTAGVPDIALLREAVRAATGVDGAGGPPVP